MKFGGEYAHNHYKVDDAIGLIKGTYTFAQDQVFDRSDYKSVHDEIRPSRTAGRQNSGVWISGFLFGAA